MGVTAMAMDIVCEDSGHKSLSTGPINFCFTIPPPAGPSPLPYVITGSSSSLDPGTDKTKQAGKKIHSSFCKIPKTNGNEPGSIATKDITVAGTNKGATWCLPVPAVTIHFEGQPVNITGNPGFGDSK